VYRVFEVTVQIRKTGQVIYGDGKKGLKKLDIECWSKIIMDCGYGMMGMRNSKMGEERMGWRMGGGGGGCWGAGWGGGLGSG
jgi:hypothetical protein